MNRPTLASHVRYRWDAVRDQHQLVFPEGVLVLNESAAALAALCDGRRWPSFWASCANSLPGAARTKCTQP